MFLPSKEVCIFHLLHETRVKLVGKFHGDGLGLAGQYITRTPKPKLRFHRFKFLAFRKLTARFRRSLNIFELSF